MLDQNEALMRPIMQEEINVALQDTPQGKSPGPDGFTADFFHFYWDLIGEEVWRLVEASRTYLCVTYS